MLPFARLLRPLLAYEIYWKAIALFLTGPLVIALLNALIALSHEPVVSNTGILSFLLSPLGVATIVVLGVVWATLALLEHAGLCVLIGHARRGRAVSALDAAIWSARRLSAIFRMALHQTVLILLAVAPFGAGIGLVYWLLLSGSDINYYLATRPPRFYVALTLGGLLALGAAAVASALFVRWLFAVPACLFESLSGKASLRRSASLTRGRTWRIAGRLLLAAARAAVLVAATCFLLDFLNGAILSRITGRSWSVVVSVVTALLAIDAVVVAAIFVWPAVEFALVTMKLYDEALRDDGADVITTKMPSEPVAERTARRWLVLALAAVSAAEGLWLSYRIVSKFAATSRVAVTAHRAGAAHGPENTVAALLHAIEEGADFAEIDVQRTSDGAVVIVHDEDLRRIANVPRKVSEMTLAEIKAVEFGPNLSPSFAPTHISTLAEFLDAAKGKIGVNIELKYYGFDPELAPEVLRIVAEHDNENVVFSSLELRALTQVRRLAPQQKIGAIISASLGNLDRLDVDFLSLRRGLVSRAIVRRAHAKRRQVHVWGVSSSGSMLDMLDASVDNLIVNDPVAALEIVHSFQGSTPVDRVVLRFREWLGSATYRRWIEPRAPEPEAPPDY